VETAQKVEKVVQSWIELPTYKSVFTFRLLVISLAYLDNEENSSMIIYTIAEKCVCDAVDDDASLENCWQQKQVRLNKEVMLSKFIDSFFFQNFEYHSICIFINKK